MNRRTEKAVRKWEVIPHDASIGRWCMIYATLSPEGEIWLSRFTHEAMGSPNGYLLLYDRDSRVVGLTVARETQAAGYPARPRGNYGGCRIRAYQFCRREHIAYEKTVRFPRAHIDAEGVLILDLKDTQFFQIRRRKKPAPPTRY